jgi:terminase small subunit-like protein
MEVGRPTLRTPELVDEFCNRIASGRSIMSVCNDNDMPESGTIYRWRQECSEFNEKIALAREERKETTRTKLVELGDRVLSDETLDPQRANAAAHAWAKAEAMMQPKTRVELSGANGGPVSVANDKPSMTVIARKIALAFYLAEREEKAGLIEDTGDGAR